MAALDKISPSVGGEWGLVFVLLSLMVALTALVPEGARAKNVFTKANMVTVAGIPLSHLSRQLRQPFIEYEAENSINSGTVIGPSRVFGSLAAEASGRRAVLLQGPGQSVSIRLERPANAITVRYAIPDSTDGRGNDSTIGLFIGNVRIASMPVTSRYSWFYGTYPFTNNPTDGSAHHFFDHTRLLLNRQLPAGTLLSIRLDCAKQVDWIAIDLVDLERVPVARKMPKGGLSLVNFGADSTGVEDSSDPFRRAITAARKLRRPLWVPPGRYRINGHFTVDQVEIAGAGLWRSTFFGRVPGLYGLDGGLQARGVYLHDFAIISDVCDRIDSEQVNAIGGAIGGGSRIERLWLQHAKVGLWFDGPINRIVISDVRIFDMTADGLNFHRLVSNATVKHLFIRGTGDDGLASWAGGGQNRKITFRDNVIVAPVLANGIALYGGKNITVDGNLIADTLLGGAIHIGNRFGAVPISGNINITRNTAVRSGSYDKNWRMYIGAIWFFALDNPIRANIYVDKLSLIDSTGDAIMFVGSSVENVKFHSLSVKDAGGPLVTTRSAGKASIFNLWTMGIKVGHRVCSPDFDLLLSSPLPNDGWCESATH